LTWNHGLSYAMYFPAILRNEVLVAGYVARWRIICPHLPGGQMSRGQVPGHD